MVGPIGSGPQVSTLTTAVQPGVGDQVRGQQQREPQENQVQQQRGAPSSGSQQVETRNQRTEETSQSRETVQAQPRESTESRSASQERGQVVDISV